MRRGGFSLHTWLPFPALPPPWLRKQAEVLPAVRCIKIMLIVIIIINVTRDKTGGKFLQIKTNGPIKSAGCEQSSLCN